MQDGYGDTFSAECRRGSWVRQRIMGKGAFGSVTLWKNEKTNEMLCIKQCHAMELSDRHRDQWQKECRIMLKLHHPNVVQGLKTPDALDPGPSCLPVLALEYCEGGDLRKVLNKPENCCGLPEPQVRAITKDTSVAVEYLHSKQIIHRDLKPENIVLKPIGNNKFQYKLIDLGYAKDVSAGSICKSFVGTEQYLAPELFTSAHSSGQSYNNNVDYWCLGTTVFECIVGFRPFFHGMPTIQWLHYVHNKCPEHICGILNLEDRVVFSSNIPSPHYLCRCSTRFFEQWLRLMLMYDANDRGGGIHNGRPRCFELLDTFLNTKILQIYRVLDNRLTSYPVQHETLAEIYDNLRQDVKLPLQDEGFLTANGELLTDDTLAQTCCGLADEECCLFLIPKAPYRFSYRRRTEPELVKYILHQEGKQTPMTFDIWKRGYSHFVYYYREVNHDYQRLLRAEKALRLYLLNKRKELVKGNQNTFANLVKLQTATGFFRQSLMMDIENLQRINLLSGEKCIQYWKRTQEKVVEFDAQQQEAQKLLELCSYLEHETETVANRFSENQNFGVQWEEEMLRIYEEIRRTPKEQREKMVRDNSKLIKHTTDFLRTSEEHVVNVYKKIETMLTYKEKIAEVLKHMQQVQSRLIQAHEKIIAFQKQRQIDIWDMLQKLSQSASSSGGNRYKCDLQSPGSGDAVIFAVPAVPAVANLVTSACQASMSSLQSNSSMVIENSRAESMLLRNESLSNVQRISQYASTVEQSLKHTQVIPDWSYLEQDMDSLTE